MSPDLPPCQPLPALAVDAAGALAMPDPGLLAGSSPLGLLEVLLPLWHARWRLLASMLLCGLLGFGLMLLQPARYTAHGSFIVQTALSPSQGGGAGALPGLAAMFGGGTSPVDLHVAVLRSHAVADRIIDRFDLVRVWRLELRAQAYARLSKALSITTGKRDGQVIVAVEDEVPARAAGMANEYVAELRQKLRDFALEEARQRRLFYEARLGQARERLEQTQKKLRSGGFDLGALKSDPRVTADSYGKLQAEIAALEFQLAGARRVRTDDSQEVRHLLTELGALRSRLAGMERAGDEAGGEFVNRVRDFKFAEAQIEALSRQAEAARIDESANPLPLQVLDVAKLPEVPSSPRMLRWPLVGMLLGLLLQAAWVSLRYRSALARLNPAYQQRLAFVRSVLERSPGR